MLSLLRMPCIMDSVEYSQSIVAYNEKRIARLTNLIAELRGEYYDR